MQHVPPAPGFAVGILRVLCNDMCTAHRFHTDDGEQKCRSGFPDELDSLSHYSESPPWRTAAVRPRRDHLLHDLITHTLLRSLQYGIVVMGVIDAFVYARNCHRRNLDNPENFGDSMEEEFAPNYAHAYQSLCLAGRALVVRHLKFRLPAVKVRYPNLP